MIGNQVLTRFIFCVVLVTFVTACSTARPIVAADSKSLGSQIAVGNNIGVERNDGSNVKFKVTGVLPDGLHGDGVFVPFADVGQVTVYEPNGSAGIVFLVLAGAAALWMLNDGVDCGDFGNPCLDD